MENEKKFCCKYQCYRDVALFREYRTCNKCREYCRKKYETGREKVREQQKRHYENNKDERREQQKEYLKEYRKIIVKCEVCDCDIKKCNKAEHEKTQKYIRNMTK